MLLVVVVVGCYEVGGYIPIAVWTGRVDGSRLVCCGWLCVIVMIGWMMDIVVGRCCCWYCGIGIHMMDMVMLLLADGVGIGEMLSTLIMFLLNTGVHMQMVQPVVVGLLYAKWQLLVMEA